MVPETGTNSPSSSKGTSNSSSSSNGTIITLIGKRQARTGHTFIYLGPLTECRECQLKNICFNLEKGRRYVIAKVRDKSHPCTQFSDEVRVVEVEQVPFKVGIPRTMVIEGSVITFHPQGCGSVACHNYSLTHPTGLEENTKIRIIKIIGDVECIDGTRFKEALVDFANA